MVRIAICDDEKEILDEVSGYITNYAEPSDAGEGRRLCDASGRHAASNLSFSAKEKSLNRKV